MISSPTIKRFIPKEADRLLSGLSDLHTAIQQAGGTVEAFSWDNLKDITAAEFLTIISMNGVHAKNINKKE